jgi:hypothetical protein
LASRAAIMSLTMRILTVALLRLASSHCPNRPL